ncbi:hypothetical protein ACP70R_046040 [Stipagrostis hirtigluma subsp. patula]
MEIGSNTYNESHKQKQSKIRRICVFCGSSEGRKQNYREAAISPGKELVHQNIDLVYGGGSIGLMGNVSNTVHSREGHVIGVIPKPLSRKEVTGNAIGDVIEVNGMHERKAEMFRLSDAFITLPGGFGTLEEFFEVITWAQLGIHEKPIGLLNVDGFYDPLLHFIDLAVAEGFISIEARRLIISSPTAEKLLLEMEGYIPKYNAGFLWTDTVADSSLADQQACTEITS